MKSKKVLLIVETTKQGMDRPFSAIAKPSKKFAGMAVISFPVYETLGSVITGARIELISVIRTKKPSSIQELARFVERDYKNVYQDVKLLAQFGLIELKEQGARKSATPVAKYSELVLAA